jgi:hypothetical protein
MNTSPAQQRVGLLVLVAALLAIPFYFDYLATLLKLVALLLSTGLVVWGLRQWPRGGPAAPPALTPLLALLGQRAARLAREIALLLAQGLRALAGGLLRWLLTYWQRLLATLFILVAFAFAVGYRLPQPDAHPDWHEFPHLTSTHFVVELIPDFDARYGPRYQLPDAFQHDGVVDSPRVTAVRVLGYRVKQNTFQVGATNGLTNSGRYTLYPPTGWCFNQLGETYLEVNVAGEKGYFKGWYSSYEPPLRFIYQYNQPTRRQDTLLLHIDGDDYRLFLR